MRKFTLYSLALGLLIFSGCHRNRAVAGANKVALAFDEPVTLEVTNHNWSDVNVYVVRGTQRTRLVTVIATQEAAVTVPVHALRPNGEIRLLAHRVGDPKSFLSEVIFAKSGSTIAWTLEADLRRSSVAVW